LDRVHCGTRPNILAIKAIVVLLLLLILLVGPTDQIHIVKTDLTLMTLAANVVGLHHVIILLRA
jgi:hypothetical protein